MKKQLLLLVGFTSFLFTMEPDITADQKGKEKVGSILKEITLKKEVKYIETSSQGNFAFMHYKDNSGALINMQTGKVMRAFKELHQSYNAPCARFSPDEKLLSLNGVHTNITKNGQALKGACWLLLNLTDHGKMVEVEQDATCDHQFSPKRNCLMLSLAHDKRKILYTFVNNGSQFYSLVQQFEDTENFSFSPDGDLLYLTQKVQGQPVSRLFHLTRPVTLEKFEGIAHGAFTQNNMLQIVQRGKLRTIDPNKYEYVRRFNEARRPKQDQLETIKRQGKTKLETELSSLQQKGREFQQRNVTKAKRGLIRSLFSFVGSSCVTAFSAWNWLKGDQENKSQNAMLTGMGAGLTVASGYRTVQNLIDYRNAKKALGQEN